MVDSIVIEFNHFDMFVGYNSRRILDGTCQGLIPQAKFLS